MKKILYFCVAVMALGLCGSCNEQKEIVPTSDSTLLRVGVLPTVDCLPFYYADSMGIFKSLGLQVELVTFSAAMDADTAFQRGWIDGVASDLVKACIWQDAGDSVGVAMVSNLRLWLVTSPGARLLKEESLKEKIVGVTRNSAVDYFSDKILEGVKLQSINLNRAQINDLRLRMLMVDQNQYDGAILPEPYASETVARGAKRLRGTENFGTENLMCVLFRDSIFKACKTDINRFRQGYDSAVVRMNADSTSSVLGYLPREHQLDMPDSLFTYVPMKASISFHDSMLVDVRKWAKSRHLIK